MRLGSSTWDESRMRLVRRLEIREGTFSGDLPYLVLGSGEPLIYLCGFTLDHRTQDRAWNGRSR